MMDISAVYMVLTKNSKTESKYNVSARRHMFTEAPCVCTAVVTVDPRLKQVAYCTEMTKILKIMCFKVRKV